MAIIDDPLQASVPPPSRVTGYGDATDRSPSSAPAIVAMDTFDRVVRIFKQIQESPNLFDHVGSAKIDLGVALLKGSKKSIRVG